MGADIPLAFDLTMFVIEEKDCTEVSSWTPAANRQQTHTLSVSRSIGMDLGFHLALTPEAF